MKRKIYIVDIHVDRLYSVQVTASSEDEAADLAKERVLEEREEPASEDIEVEDIYEVDDFDE